MSKQLFAFALLIAASSVAIASEMPNVPAGDGLLSVDIPQKHGRQHSSGKLQRRGFTDKIELNKKIMEEKIREQVMREMGLPPPPGPSVPPGYNHQDTTFGGGASAFAAFLAWICHPFEQPQPTYHGEPSAPTGHGYPFQHLKPQDGRYNQVPSASSSNYIVENPKGRASQVAVFSPMTYASSSTTGARGVIIKKKLDAIISDKKLNSFYSEKEIQKIVGTLVNVDWAGKAREWNIAEDMIYDLAPLALYDIVFFCDDSGSMVFNERGERVKELKEILKKVAGIATLFDEDGIEVRFINSDVKGNNIKNPQDVENLIHERFQFAGMTPLGTQFNQKVLQPLVLRPASMGNLKKPVLAIVITDGKPTDNNFQSVISDAKTALKRPYNRYGNSYGDGAVAISIAQVGLDLEAQDYISKIDNDPTVGHMVDGTSSYELEQMEMKKVGDVQLTPGMWLVKLCVGAFDKDYDGQDERKKRRT